MPNETLKKIVEINAITRSNKHTLNVFIVNWLDINLREVCILIYPFGESIQNTPLIHYEGIMRKSS